MTNKTLIFKKIPTGFPVPGEHLVVEDRPFDLDAAPPADGVVVKILAASFDPFLRGKMRDPSVKSYTPPFQVGAPIVDDAVAKVLKSADGEYAEGDLVIASLPIAEYAVASKSAIRRKVVNPHNLDLGYFIGPLGMPGLTAFSSLYKIGRPQQGETIFVSSAAGAVGQVVGQLAKHEGLKVIGSVGSDEKLSFILNELDFDAGFNYKKEKPVEALARLAPDGIDIYFENVGGEHLDAALVSMKRFGRIIVCGFVCSLFATSPSRSFQLIHNTRSRNTTRGRRSDTASRSLACCIARVSRCRASSTATPASDRCTRRSTRQKSSSGLRTGASRPSSASQRASTTRLTGSWGC
jgi:NADPH-dependent curcumin reductase CurA